MNYMLQDIIEVTLAFCLFPLIIVFPGYVVSSALNLFDFRHRRSIVKLGLGIIVSFAISPIIFNLTSSLVSTTFSLFAIGGFALVFLIIFARDAGKSSWRINPEIKTILWIDGIWVIFVILSLVDIQWKDQLYFSIVSFDQTSRVSVIEAMTRTGVPPVNPSYYPGTPVPLTFLYYFWYILASLVDVMGGQLVDARAALNASSAWSGIGLITTIAMYLRSRNTSPGTSAWRSARIGISLLAVSGLDVLPTIIIIIGVGRIYGTVEGWNLQMQIPTWISSILWAPHHVAAVVACLSAIMLALLARNEPAAKIIAPLTIAGMAFASSFGLSIWVTFLFGIFWVIWIIVLIIQKTKRTLIASMILCEVVAILLAGPFIVGLLQTGGDGGTGQSTIIFEVRTLYLLEAFLTGWPPILRSLVMLALLPINYFFELGFFLVAGFYWLKMRIKATIWSNPFYLVEIILMIVVLLIGSSLRSTIANNDLGWRVWLPGQFILLIWGIDVIEFFFPPQNSVQPSNIKPAEMKEIRRLLLVLIVVGVLTSSVDAFFLRITWPLRVGAESGREGYSARLAYDYLRDHVPADVITQNNPLNTVDRPSGLYGTHQMAISDRTVYGVSLDIYNEFAKGIGAIFTVSDADNWQLIDQTCRKYSIDILIVNDVDPLWNSLAKLRMQRPALYENAHYAIFACGDYSKNSQP